MKLFVRWLCILAALLSGAALAQGTASTVLIGNASANDTQAGANDRFAELLTLYSNGRLKASARHGESLGNNAQMIAALQAGSIQGMVCVAGFLAPVVPEFALFDLPFLLPGAPAGITAFAAQSKAAAKMKEAAEARGIHVLGFHGIGAQSLLTKFPIAKLADIRGKKFRVIPSPPRVGAYKDWGAVARPMEFSEVYTALEQGALDGVENPPDILYKMKMHEVAKYYTVTEHFAYVSNVIVSKKWFDALPRDLQEAVARAGRDTIAWADQAYTRSQAESLEAMRKVITVTNMPAAELQKMKELAHAGVWESLKNDPQRGPLVKLLEQDVANYARK